MAQALPRGNSQPQCMQEALLTLTPAGTGAREEGESKAMRELQGCALSLLKRSLEKASSAVTHSTRTCHRFTSKEGRSGKKAARNEWLFFLIGRFSLLVRVQAWLDLAVLGMQSMEAMPCLRASQ